MNKKLLTALILAACSVILSWLFLPYATLEKLQESRAQLQVFVDTHYALSVTLYTVLYALCVTLSLPVAALLTLAGGLLFGVIRGTLYAVLAATIGATGAFLIVRYLVGNWVQRRFKDRLEPVNVFLRQYGAVSLIFARLIPLFPFFAVTIIAGLTRISVLTFMLTTLMGILPSAFLIALAGRNISMVSRLSDFMAPSILGFAALIFLITFVVLFFRHRFGQKK